MKKILIINENPIQNNQLTEIMKTLDYEPIYINLYQKALSYIILPNNPKPDILLADITIPNEENINLLRMINAAHPKLPIIILTQPTNNNILLSEIKNIANEIIEKPFINEKLELSIKTHLKIHKIVKNITKCATRDFFKINDFVGTSHSWLSIINQAQIAANSKQNVLIYGEAGVGKNLLSHIIHDESLRRHHKFISTKITNDEQIIRKHCQAAQNGSLQLKVEEGTNFDWQSINAIAREHNMRLFIIYKQQNSISNKYIQNLFSIPETQNIYIPPLRHRQEDILSIAEHFNKYFSKTYCKRHASLSSKAITHLISSPWLENVRQIQWIFQQIIYNHSPKTITSKQIIETNQNSPWEAGSQQKKHVKLYTENGKLRSLDDIEQEIIRHALLEGKESRCEIAKKLGIGRTTLYRKVQQQQSA